MPKGIREPLQELEGGKGFGGMGGGGGGGGGVRYKTTARPDPVAKEMEDLQKAGIATVGTAGVGLGAASAMDSPNRRAAAERKDKAEREAEAELKRESRGMKKGGMTASKRADGIAQRGKTRGKMV